MTTDSLLPQNASAVERAFEQATAGRLAVPVPLRDLASPLTAPEAFVPFLAWGLSTDLWDTEWPIEKKRAVAAASFDLHRKKGTLEGISAAVRWFDARVLAARVPPDGFYPDKSLTKAEREAYLARLRQLRFSSFRSGERSAPGAFPGAGGRRRRILAPGATFFPVMSTAAARIGRRAFLYDPLTGIEQPVTTVRRVVTTETRTAVEIDQAVIPGLTGYGFYAGVFPKGGRIFPCSMAAANRIYTVTWDRTYVETETSLAITSTMPSVEPVDVRPRRINAAGKRVAGQLFPGGKAFLHGVFLPPSTAALRVYDVLYLHDPERVPNRRGARAFAGHFRLGMPAYHARLTVEVQSVRPHRAFGRFAHGFLVASSRKKATQVLGAIRGAKALRDNIVVKTSTLRTVTVADSPRVGSTSVGELIRDL